MRFRGRVFATLAGARNARTNAGYTLADEWVLTHHEVNSPALIGRGGFCIVGPGNAAARLRTRGVTSRRIHRILRNAAGTLFACPEAVRAALTGATDIDDGSFDDGDETT